MGVIKIDKKATTEAEERLFLEQIYAQPDSFGVPTKFINVEQYRASTKNMKDFRRAIKRDVYAFVKANISNPVYGFYKAREAANNVCWDIVGYEHTNEGRLYCEVHNVGKKGFMDRASSFYPEEYKDHYAGIIIASKLNVSGKEVIAHSLGIMPGMEDLLSLPGSDVQWQINRALHEKAHIAGAGEPQADMMVAVEMRQKIKEDSVIAARADSRLIASMLCYDNLGMQAEYAGTVEANDYIRFLPIEVIDKITPEQLKNMTFRQFAAYDFSTERVGKKIESKVGKDKFQPYFLDTLSKATQNLCANGEISNNKERQIAMRFSLAAKRLFLGKDAYGPNAEYLIAPELLESERAAPITFTPGEYVPA